MNVRVKQPMDDAAVPEQQRRLHRVVPNECPHPGDEFRRCLLVLFAEG